MSGPLRVVFAGTPEFAVPSLKACCAVPGVELIGAYTQPDRPAGRGRTPTASPVKQAATAAGITVEQPATLKSREAQAQLSAFAPDLMIVVAYGLILPQAILDMPRRGCWNVHASLLPRWRGAAPIQRAIAAGDSETGVCLMRMEAGLDTGPVMLRKMMPIADDATGGSVHDKLAVLAAELLDEALRRTLDGEILAATPQSTDGVTYAHKLNKAEATLDASRPASELERTIRAFDPWPGATLEINGERVRILRAELMDGTTQSVPGRILAAGAAGIDIACAPGSLRIRELQRAGGRRITAADYVNAHPALRGST
jgi:methionyl-tRNA formyltransferase